MPEDTLTLTIRVHDPKEKKDPKKSAQWVTAKVARSDVGMSKDEFLARYIVPALPQLTILNLKEHG